MGGASTRAYSGARQTWVRKSQLFIEKLGFEVAQRVVLAPVLWMMNPVQSGLGGKGPLSAIAILLSRAASRCSKDIVRSMSGTRSGLNLL